MVKHDRKKKRKHESKKEEIKIENHVWFTIENFKERRKKNPKKEKKKCNDFINWLIRNWSKEEKFRKFFPGTRKSLKDINFKKEGRLQDVWQKE